MHCTSLACSSTFPISSLEIGTVMDGQDSITQPIILIIMMPWGWWDGDDDMMMIRGWWWGEQVCGWGWSNIGIWMSRQSLLYGLNITECFHHSAYYFNHHEAMRMRWWWCHDVISECFHTSYCILAFANCLLFWRLRRLVIVCVWRLLIVICCIWCVLHHIFTGLWWLLGFNKLKKMILLLLLQMRRVFLLKTTSTGNWTEAKPYALCSDIQKRKWFLFLRLLSE